MFQKVVIRRSDSGGALSLGELAEALLFYQNVHLILDYPSLNSLLSSIKMPDLLALLARRNVTAVYCEDTVGNRKDVVGGRELYGFTAFSWSGSQDLGTANTPKQRLEQILIRHGYSRRWARKYTERFRRHVPVKRLVSDHFVDGGVVNVARRDLEDSDFVREAIRRVVTMEVGKEPIPDNFDIKIAPQGAKYTADTNLDLKKVDMVFQKRYGPTGQRTLSHYLLPILDGRTDTILAAHYGGEFVTSPKVSEIVKLINEDLLKRIGIDKSELREFNDIVLHDLPSVRDAINSGERTFDEFLKVLERSDKFRAWIANVSPDNKLVATYLRDVTQQGWMAKLPTRMIRYVSSSAATYIEPIVGALASTADAFVAEKLAGGWRPNHFVESKLKPFLQDNGN